MAFNPLRLSILLIFLATTYICQARSARFRSMWRENPSSTMVIGWDQVSGANPTLYLDVVDHGTNASAYRLSRRPTHIVQAKGMNNHFVRLTDLRPNTIYYFVIKDSEGSSNRMSFKTAPNNPDERLSIIAGGDSRNNREARRDANKLVSKLRPHCIMFGGDMTASDKDQQWRDWFDDWQLTMGSDGRLFPIIPARGNHEASNRTLVDLFDVKSPDIYYALTLGGNLLRIYTLNSLIAPAGNQRDWLERDLKASTPVIWKFAQYHHTIRPHTEKKPERDELVLHWATLFHKFGLKLVVESDAHVVKWTYPIRPSRSPGSQQGFIRDDEKGTVYVGEGCWGAPLRTANDNKVWTRDSDSFNQFKWIFVDRYQIEVRTIKTDGADRVGEVDHYNVFEPPYGLVLWRPKNGDVVRIKNKNIVDPPIFTGSPEGDILASKKPMEIVRAMANQQNQDVVIEWVTLNEFNVHQFELQRSTDGGNQFLTIRTLPGKGPGQNNYTCQDFGVAGGHPLNKVHYRLRCIRKNGEDTYHPLKLHFKSPATTESTGFPKLLPDGSGKVQFKYSLTQVANVDVILMNPRREEVSRISLLNQRSGDHFKTFDLTRIPPGQYVMIIKANGNLVKGYRVDTM